MIPKLHTNQQLLVDELILRGATIRVIDLYDELLEISYKGKKDFLLDRFSSVVPFTTSKITADKHLSKSYLVENNISTPYGNVFTYNRKNEALIFAEDNYPLVLKPNWGSHGDHVVVNIRNKTELMDAMSFFSRNCGNESAFILEKFYDWNEYRLFITSQNGFAVIHREPASVIGNGVSNIKDLIAIENERRKILKQTENTSLCPIVLDEEVHKTLLKNGIHQQISYVPRYNEKVFLRKESNLAKGGLAIDYTDLVHPDIKKLAISTLKVFQGMPVAGLDLLCEDVTQPLKPENHVIIEVNSSPGLAMHTYPSIGKSRNVASLLADVMFPDLPSVNT
jgi:cyanophycin synthetase